ncbi:MAG TPA: hypothetical protein VLG47_01080, partial [Candidatus Saccharimonadales bacterium]|nr:hypothetical protein [Candidatus Saccharimonadales bacterium]
MSSTSPSIDGDQPVADQQDPSFSDLGVSSSLELDKVGSDSADLTSTAVVNEQKTSPRRFVGITLIALGLAGIALFGLHNTNDSQAFTPDAYQKSQLYKVQSVPLNDITSQLQANALQNAGSFSINGLLKVNKSIVLQPIASPSDAVQGQIYYDKNKNQLTYFNGSQFVYLQKSGTGTSIGGASGAIALTAGLSLSGNSLANTGVLSVNGQTGDVTFSGGSGISVSGSTIKNTGVTSFGGRTGSITLGNGLAMSGGQIRSTGVLSLSSGTPTLQITDDGSGNLTITNVGGGSGNVSTAGGTSGTLALFNGAAAIGDSIVSQSGTTVTVGGTLSATTLQGNGSGITNINASNISSGTLANTRLSASVTLQGNAFNAANELVQLNGTGGLPALDGSLLTNLNGSNISSGTVADARLSANVTKQGNVFNGVSQLVQTNGSGGLPALNGSLLTNLNASNVSSGTLSDTRLSANVTLQGNTFNVANALLQLDATGKIPALNGSLITSLNASNISSGTVNDARLSGNVPLLNSNNNFTGATLQHNGNNICDTTGNCAGTGGGVTTSGGTSGTLSLFTGAQTIGDSILSQSGTTVTVAGTLSATTLTGAGSGITSLNASNISSGTLADGRLSANVTLQGNAFNGANELVQLNGTAGLPALNGSLLTNLNATNIASGTLSDSRLSSNVALLNGNNNFTGATLQHNGNNVCDASGNCAGVGGGVTTSGGTTGTISLFTGAQSIGDSVLSQSGTTLTVAGTLSATTLTGAGSGITSLNASNVSSGTLADGRLSANVTLQGNTFNGNNQLVQLNGTGGLPALDGSLLTSLNASNISSGTLNDARLSANAALYNRATSNFTGALQQGGNNVCTTAGNCAGAGSGGGITNSGTQNYLTKTDGSGNITDSLIYDSGTQIGVKTNTPGYDFDVNGSANATTLYQNGNQVCDSSGLIAGCAGSGGNVSTTGGTTRKIAMFTGANAIGDSILAQNVAGDTITVGGTLSATDLQGDGSGITNINAS